MIFLRALWGRIWPYIAAVGAVLAGLLAVRQGGKAAGKSEARIDQLEADAKAVGVARNVENETAALDDGAVSDRLKSEWLRGRK